MTKGQEQVKDFMRFFGQDCPNKPTQINEDTAKLRARLILEEAFETITQGLGLNIILKKHGDSVMVNEESLSEWLKEVEAVTFQKLKEVDLNKLSDGLADLAYVSEFGTAVAAGIDLEPIQEIVHFSNMTKAWKEEDLEEAKRLYPTALVEAYGGGLYRLIREDGKVIKSPHFKDPTDAIAAEIERQRA